MNSSIMARTRPRIRAVLFDLGGTLVDSRDFPELEEIAEQVGLKVDADTFAHWFRSVTETADQQQAQPPEEEFWRQVIEGANGRPLSAAQWAGFYRRLTLRPARAHLFSDVRLSLEALRDNRIAMGVVSNHASEEALREVLEGAGIATFFATVVAAGTEKVWKPDPEIFRRALRRLQLEGPQVLYVGDQPNLDVRAAQRAGLHAVWLHRDGTGFGTEIPEITSLAEVPIRIAEIEVGEVSPSLTSSPAVVGAADGAELNDDPPHRSARRSR